MEEFFQKISAKNKKILEKKFWLDFFSENFMYILIKIHIFCMFGFSGRVCNFSGSGRVGFVIFFSGSGRVRVSKKPLGRVGFSGFWVPDPSLESLN